jgi:hypothetical protein
MTTINPSFPPKPDAPEVDGLPKTSFGDLENIINRLKTRRERIFVHANKGLNRFFPDSIVKDNDGDILPVGSTIEDYDTAIAELESILQSSIAGYEMSPQSVPENINIDDMMMAPSRPSPQDPLTIDNDLPEISEIGANSSLSKLQIKDKKTNSTYSLPVNFEQQVKDGTIGGMTLYSIINNRDFEFSPDVAVILENFSEMDEPFRISQKLGGSFEERRGTFASPGDFSYGAQEIGRQFGNIASPIAESIAGFLGELGGGSRGRKAAKDFIPDIDISKSDIGLARLLQIPGVSYNSPEVYDATKDLEDIAADDVKDTTKEETPTTNDDATGTPTTEDETATEDKAIKGASTDPKGTGDKPGEDLEEDSPIGFNTINEDDSDAEEIANSIFNSKDNLRLMRNVGKALTQYGNFAEGIGVGTAAAAEERVLEEQLDAKRDAELALVEAKEGGPRDNALIKTIRDAKVNIGENYRDFQEANSTINLTNQVLDFINDGDITSLASRLGVAQDKLLTLAGLGPEDIEDQSPRGRAQNALTILKQKNIKAILNESSRTISNIDRDIADRIAGSLEDFDLTTPGALKQKLEETIRSSTESRRNAKISASAEADLLRETGDYKSLNSALKDFLQQEVSSEYVPTGANSSSTNSSPKPSGIFIDTT